MIFLIKRAHQNANYTSINKKKISVSNNKIISNIEAFPSNGLSETHNFKSVILIIILKTNIVDYIIYEVFDFKSNNRDISIEKLKTYLNLFCDDYYENILILLSRSDFHIKIKEFLNLGSSYDMNSCFCILLEILKRSKKSSISYKSLFD